MRLLNVKTLELQEFFDESVPPYIILSHRWGADEVSYEIFSKRHKQKHQAFLRESQGFRKIRDFCYYGPKIHREKYCKGRTDTAEVEWVWIDTCNIDKRSSAELSEAINSMYRWYQSAELCCAYLEDVRQVSDFQHSQWFTRGWTLQELIAPENMEFVDSRWSCLGSKKQLAEEIARITLIDADCLLHNTALRFYSIACRISWAAHRRTTRKEDEAYCLLGLLGVNIPLLYGERENAFRRLMLEIIRTSADQSVFAFSGDSFSKANGFGMLADGPQLFASGKQISMSTHVGVPGNTKPYQMTNLGLEMEVHYFEPSRMIRRRFKDIHDFGEVCIALLGCSDSVTERPIMLALWNPLDLGWHVLERNQDTIWDALTYDVREALLKDRLNFKTDTLFIQ